MMLSTTIHKKIENTLPKTKWLTVPNILPEEFATGYQSRLKIANGLHSDKELFQHLTAECPDIFSSPKVKLLAGICGIPLPKFVGRHTLKPFTNAFVHEAGMPRFYGEDIYGEDIDSHLRRGTLSMPKGHVSACPECAFEDVEFWGFSYWRRIHQIPGVEWCPKHDIRLVDIDKKAIDSFPHNFIGATRTRQTKSLAQVSPGVTRYTDLVSSLLDVERSMSMQTLQFAIRNRARQIGQMLKPEKKRSLISDLAIKTFPTDWLVHLLPAFAKKKNQKPLSVLDGISNQGSSQVACIVALTALFPSADEAMQKLKAIEQLGSIEIKPKPQNMPTDFWNSRQCAEIYERHQGNAQRIADDLGLTLFQLKRHLRKAKFHHHLASANSLEPCSTSPKSGIRSENYWQEFTLTQTLPA